MAEEEREEEQLGSWWLLWVAFWSSTDEDGNWVSSLSWVEETSSYFRICHDLRGRIQFLSADSSSKVQQIQEFLWAINVEDFKTWHHHEVVASVWLWQNCWIKPAKESFFAWTSSRKGSSVQKVQKMGMQCLCKLHWQSNIFVVCFRENVLHKTRIDEWRDANVRAHETFKASAEDFSA